MSARNESNIGSIESSDSFKLSFIPEGKFKKLYLHDEQAGIDILMGKSYELIDEDGPGQVVAYEVATDTEDLIFECFVYGDNISVKRTINSFTMSELLRLGRGLTPGEIEITPDGQSKDPPGSKDDQYPWISRWKLDGSEDATGSEKKYIVSRFTPAVYQPYRRIIVNLFNASQTQVAHIHNLSITRFFFEKIYGPDEAPPKIRNTGETFMVEKNVTPETEYSDDILKYDFDPVDANASIGAEQPQETEQVEDVDDF